jgi:hypothetical protein
MKNEQQIIEFCQEQKKESTPKQARIYDSFISQFTNVKWTTKNINTAIDFVESMLDPDNHEPESDYYKIAVKVLNFINR